MSISGLILQFYYHVLNNTSESVFLSLTGQQWNTIHIWSATAFVVAAIYHIWIHRKWYDSVLKRNINTTQRATIVLTIFVLIVTLSGLIPLLLLFSKGALDLRFMIIEIHDKVAIVFLIVAISHTKKRFKWYLNTIRSKF